MNKIYISPSWHYVLSSKTETIWCITTRELRSLFVSPIAWVLLVVFVVQAAYVFLVRLEWFSGQEFDGLVSNFSMAFEIYATPLGSLTSELRRSVFLYVPLLTMSLLSREVQSGSIKLLLSSPVGLAEVVVGKYLAIISYFFLFILLLLGFGMVLDVYAPKLDWPVILVSLLGFYMLICAYSAIGLFVSSLTQYPVVAAIGTLAILSVFQFIGGVGQRVPFFDDVTYWLDMPTRAGFLLTGLLASKDIVYFVVVILIFLGLTYLRLSSGRTSKPNSQRYVRIGFIVVALGAGAALSSLPRVTVYLDATHNQLNSLPPTTKTLLENMEGPWGVNLYINVLGDSASLYLPGEFYGYNANYRRMFERYTRVNPDFNLNYVFYYAEPEADRRSAGDEASRAKEFAKQNRLPFSSLKTLEEVQDQAGRSIDPRTPTYVISWRDRTEEVRTFTDGIQRPLEREFSAGLQRLIYGPQTIGYATGNGERSVYTRSLNSHRTYMTPPLARASLVNVGFEVVELNLLESELNEIDILVLADPDGIYTQDDIRAINSYLENGGNLLVMSEPDSSQYLSPVLNPLGVYVEAEPTIQSKDGYADTVVFGDFEASSAEIGYSPPKHTTGRSIVMPGVSEVSYKPVPGIEAEPVVTSRHPWTLTTDLPVQTKSLAIAMKREIDDKEQRILVLGDADFLTTGVMDSGEFSGHLNYQLLAQSYRWLSGDKYPADTSRNPPLDPEVGISLHQVDHWKFVFYTLLPGLLILWGTVLLTLRRRN